MPKTEEPSAGGMTWKSFVNFYYLVMVESSTLSLHGREMREEVRLTPAHLLPIHCGPRL